MMEIFFKDYLENLSTALKKVDTKSIDILLDDILKCAHEKKTIFLCGNGGSAGNANHLANDFVYGVAKAHGCGLNAISLSANASVITCLGNDLGYENIFSEQLSVHARAGDILIVLTGSGNSKNILKVLSEAKSLNVNTHAIVGYDGGQAKKISDNFIHIPIDDMQISEDFQLIVGHVIMQKIYKSEALKK